MLDIQLQESVAETILLTSFLRLNWQHQVVEGLANALQFCLDLGSAPDLQFQLVVEPLDLLLQPLRSFLLGGFDDGLLRFVDRDLFKDGSVNGGHLRFSLLPPLPFLIQFAVEAKALLLVLLLKQGQFPLQALGSLNGLLPGLAFLFQLRAQLVQLYFHQLVHAPGERRQVIGRLGVGLGHRVGTGKDHKTK